MGLRKGEQAGATWLLSGIPRSGSSLCCRLVGQLPNTVALSEPIDNARFHDTTDARTACDRIAAHLAEARRRIVEEGRAPTVHVRGRLPDQMVAAGDGHALRRPRTERGLVAVAKPKDANFTLVVKHNALFAALLRPLAERFPCLALVRNPVAVLASWETVDLPVRRGRVPAGERFDPALRDALDAQEMPLQRRLTVLNWFFERFLRTLPRERIMRYEDVMESGGGVLRHALGGGAAPVAAALANQNINALYQGVAAAPLLAALLAGGGAWTAFYSEADCRAVADALDDSGPKHANDGGET